MFRTIRVRPPAALLSLNPRHTTVVVFSCFMSEIAAAIHGLGPFSIVSAAQALSTPSFSPLSEMVGYFAEVERYYPVIFDDPRRLEAAA